MMDIREALQQYFGYNEFRHNQQEIIENVLAKNDTLRGVVDLEVFARAAAKSK